MIPDPCAATRLVGPLADPARRLVVAALVLGNATLEDLCSATALDKRAVVTALQRLVAGELVLGSGDGSYFLIGAAFTEAARAAAPVARAQDHGDASAEVARVLRTFVRDGRLLAIPVPRSKRLVVLDVVVPDFRSGGAVRRKGGQPTAGALA